MITDIRYVFRIGEWVMANPDGLVETGGQIGYVTGEKDGKYIINAVDGVVASEPRWMRRLSNEDVLGFMQSFKSTWVCFYSEPDIPEQLGMFK